ncbi:hypothetical protein B0H14DRAFT_2592886 [Mycena olivaceomarginata]|nr:hypothetical protein B0H14DRAFT_2592886 [Mycena olivaceomarginata]
MSLALDIHRHRSGRSAAAREYSLWGQLVFFVPVEPNDLKEEGHPAVEIGGATRPSERSDEPRKRVDVVVSYWKLGTCDSSRGVEDVTQKNIRPSGLRGKADPMQLGFFVPSGLLKLKETKAYEDCAKYKTSLEHAVVEFYEVTHPSDQSDEPAKRVNVAIWCWELGTCEHDSNCQ